MGELYYDFQFCDMVHCPITPLHIDSLNYIPSRKITQYKVQKFKMIILAILTLATKIFITDTNHI